MKIEQTKVEAYPSPLGPMVIAYVLTSDTLGQFAAYCGILADNDAGRFDFDWIGHHGSKLTEQHAARHFTFNRQLYRR